jgi:hypothetical protein
MKTKSSVFSGSALVLLLLFSIGWYHISRAGSDQAPSEAQSAPQSPGETIVVTNTADSGPGTLRQALLDAHLALNMTLPLARGLQVVHRTVDRN